MAKSLGRWKCADASDANGQPFLATRAAPLREDQEIEDDEPHGAVRHTHIWLPPLYGQPAPQASPRRTADQAQPQRTVVRRRDQAGEPEPGQLVCRLAQNGADGTWRGEDCDGRPLVVTRAGDGTLEIRHAGAEETDPDKITAPIGQVPNIMGASRDFARRMSAAIAPTGRAQDRDVSRLRGYARMLAEHYKRPT
jgi:hypothetical protein